MSVPVSVSVPEHAHAHHCPITGHGTHAYCPPQKGDSRSPCPALNALANHGYLPRDGKCVTPAALTHALRAGYRLSAPLAWVLTRGGFFLLGQRRAHICLADLARHNCIEHDASLVHPDVAHRDEYAPLHPAPHMLDAFLAHAADGALMTPADVARARVAREASYARPMDALHAEIARGEMAIVLLLFNNPPPAPSPAPAPPPRSLLAALKRTKDAEPAPLPLPGVPVEMLRTWMHEERLPNGWAPYHQLSLTRVVQTSRAIRAAMRALQRRRAKLEVAREIAQADALEIVTAAQAELGLLEEREREREEEEEGEVVELEVGASPPESLVPPDSPTTSDASVELRTPTAPEFPPAPADRKSRTAEWLSDIDVPRIVVADGADL
ncbi:hypothetical protein SCP_0200740 [Sparassis crispa]|uniref:Heme haloperoxidase family profile domain-containing protein n=1 Tax=Sparassis crispa TaxID=139825 RepID=A0A401G9P3_9APHY|nr:hypothetical protein SCP_0200740 [Sparassis crispa]GBE78877.1 hypothetical protein SCP_0200740 [Sparassis crispa]